MIFVSISARGSGFGGSGFAELVEAFGGRGRRGSMLDS